MSPDDAGRGEEVAALDLLNGQVVHHFSVHPTTDQIIHQACMQWKMRPAAIKPRLLESPIDLAEEIEDSSAVIIDVSGLQPGQVQPLLRSAAARGIAIVTLLPLNGARMRDQFLPPSGARHVKLQKPIKTRELLRGLAELAKSPRHGVKLDVAGQVANPTPAMEAPPPQQPPVDAAAQAAMLVYHPSAPDSSPQPAAPKFTTPDAPPTTMMTVAPPGPVPAPAFSAVPIPQEQPPMSPGDSLPPAPTPIAAPAPAPPPELQRAMPGSGSRAGSGDHDVEVSESTNRAISKAAKAGGATFASQYPARMLLVEDQPLNQKITAMLLQRLGYAQIDIANNGQEAVTMVGSGAYDIIFMDLQMPVMGGVDATRHIRSNFQLRNQPAIIAMTGHALTGVKEECRAVGMNAFLTKPVSLDDFRRVIPPSLEANAASTPMVEV